MRLRELEDACGLRGWGVWARDGGYTGLGARPAKWQLAYRAPYATPHNAPLAASEDEAMIIDAILGGLDPHRQEICRRLYVYGWSVRFLAVALGVSRRSLDLDRWYIVEFVNAARGRGLSSSDPKVQDFAQA